MSVGGMGLALVVALVPAFGPPCAVPAPLPAGTPLVAAIGGSGAQGARFDRLAAFELTLVGPLDGPVVELSGGGRAAVEGRFPAGAREVRELLLPRGTRLAEPRLVSGDSDGTTAGGGRVEARHLPERDAARAARFEALPRLLRARPPVAPPEAGVPRPSSAALWAVAALFVACWCLRRRPALCLALGAVGAGGVFALASAGAAGAAARVFAVAEGYGEDPSFVLVEAARAELFLGGADDLLRLETRPPEAALGLSSSGPTDLTVRAEGASIHAFREGSALTAAWDHNGVFDLERVWYRGEGAGVWEYMGPWARGEGLGRSTPPAAEPAPPDPPGWLLAGLPQGSPALVGGGGSRWLRWVGARKPAGGD